MEGGDADVCAEALRGGGVAEKVICVSLQIRSDEEKPPYTHIL